MILGFKEQFEIPILAGHKIHTIREDKHDRWKIGYWIHFAVGVRTKKYRCFKQDICDGTQKIKINHSPGYAEVLIDGKFFGEIYHYGLDDIHEYTNDLLILAENDGFNCLSDFFNWFNKDFSGKIIHWTSLRY